MNYHMIRTDDMLNGDGLRVIIFLSGCEHHCNGCHNPETWDVNSGKEFTESALEEILHELDKKHISGITLSGGDPLHEQNIDDVFNLVKAVKTKYPNKTVWIYTGYSLEEINLLIKGLDEESCRFNRNNKLRMDILEYCDVLCDGRFDHALADVNCPWVGSTNQRVIDVRKTLDCNEIVLYETKK